MSTPVRVAIIVVCVVAVFVNGTAIVEGRSNGTVTVSTPSTGNASARLVEIAPNPVAYGDRGEHVVLSFPTPTNTSGWTIEDGETVVALPDRIVSGHVAVSTEPAAIVTNNRVIAVDGRLALSNQGETVQLRSHGRVIDEVSYTRAPEGERYVLTADGWQWQPAGVSDLPIFSVPDAPIRVFALPDAPNESVSILERATDRILLAGYTFESDRVVEALCARARDDVDVRVLVEREPVGGITTRAATRLEQLTECDIPVQLLGGPHARYSFHHAKYAVVDDRGLVLSENWKPSGSGGRSNRGWGVMIDEADLADALARVFQADTTWLDTKSWDDIQPADPVEPSSAATRDQYPSRFAPQSMIANRVDLLVAPDNAEDGVVELLENAEESIRIQQLSIGEHDHPFVNATLAAARRGVSVQVLLSGVSYVARENEATVEWLNGLASNESLPLDARIVDPRSRFGKVHVKGVIADDTVVVGSLNWNTHATRENREVIVVLHGQNAATYYARVFDADWRGGVWRVPIGATIVVFSGGLIGVAVTTRWQFAPESHLSPRPHPLFGGETTRTGGRPWDHPLDDLLEQEPERSRSSGHGDDNPTRWE